MEIFIVILFSAMGALMLWFAWVFEAERRTRSRAIPVDLIVTDVEAVHADARITYRPHFLVLRGPHEGKRLASAAAAYPALHTKNDYVRGHYDPKTDTLLSEKETRTHGLAALALGAIGLAFLAAAAWFAAVL